MKLAMVSALSILFLAACAREEHRGAPLVSGLVQTHGPFSLRAAGRPAVTTELTLRREALLERDFLYGTTLQASSIRSDDDDVRLMALAGGQLPARFLVVGDKLRLVSESSLSYESEINRPERLIQEFDILRESEETLTIRVERASPILETFFYDQDYVTAKDGEGDSRDLRKSSRRYSFVRSLEYVAEKELFLIESTVEMKDGSILAVMETLAPRERLVPNGAKPFYASPKLNPLAKRYRFLTGERVYLDVPGHGRRETELAERFQPRGEEPILWYATRNTPDEYLPELRAGVEGWNRYAQAMWGRDLVRFAGKLPEGAKLGDPRYNVIAWDTAPDAGSAFESQNADPETGVQIHALIYLPSAWVKIGKEFWENVEGTQRRTAVRTQQLRRFFKRHRIAGRALPVRCLEGAHMKVSLASRDNAEGFGRMLLRTTIHHEVGHGLGIDHNFKGSLSFDPETGQGFSASIMDYNQYQEEGAAFPDVNGAGGPLLEYDRQILSVLYNEGRDVRPNDPVLPACNDEEADSTEDGVDPLCLRYDLGRNPVAQASRALTLLQQREARSGNLGSLPLALERSWRDLTPPSQLSGGTPERAVNRFVQGIKGTVDLYVAGSSSGIGTLAANAVRALFVTRPGVLPPGYDEHRLRDEALTVLDEVLGTNAFPPATKATLAGLRSSLEGYLGGATGAEPYLAKAEQELGKLEAEMLSKMRQPVIEALAYSSSAPLSFHVRKGRAIDLEAHVLAQLERIASTRAGNLDRSVDERVAAVKTLATYAELPAGTAALLRVQAKLDLDISVSRDAREREKLRKVRAEIPEQ